MNKKTKFVSVLAALSLCVCPMALGNTSAQAETRYDLAGTVWRFDDNISFSSIFSSSDDASLTFNFHFFDANGARFDVVNIDYFYDRYTEGDSQIYYYVVDSAGDPQGTMVYDSRVLDQRWRGDYYRTIYIDSVDRSVAINLSEFLEMFAEEVPQRYNFFDSIFELLNDLFFGGRVKIEDHTYQSLILQLLTCIFTIGFIVLPFVVVYWILRWIGSLFRAV